MEQYFNMSDTPKDDNSSINGDAYGKQKAPRKRTSVGERNFTCGCGKCYLSYPALYTHVKNKHDGVFPIGSNAKRKISNPSDENLQLFVSSSIDKFYKEFKDLVE